MSPGKTDLAEQLREAILKSGRTSYAVAKSTGIAESVLARFLVRLHS